MQRTATADSTKQQQKLPRNRLGMGVEIDLEYRFPCPLSNILFESASCSKVSNRSCSLSNTFFLLAECDGTGEPNIEPQVKRGMDIFPFFCIVACSFPRSNLLSFACSSSNGQMREQNALIAKASVIQFAMYARGKLWFSQQYSILVGSLSCIEHLLYRCISSCTASITSCSIQYHC